MEENTQNVVVKKSNNGLIVILILIILGLACYIVYDKILSKEPTNDNGIIDNNGEVVDDNEEETTVVGYYKAGSLAGSEKTEGSNCVTPGTREINLLSDGTFISKYSSGCDSAKQEGTYTINGNKISLVCNANSEQCPEGTITEYILNEDGTLSDSDTNNDNTVIGTYAKTQYDQLELLNK